MSAYTSFIILGQQRTGSVLLQQLLNSHPNILCASEVFNPALLTNLERPIDREDDPISFLNNVVFKEYPSNIKAVGFRLFYNHAQNKKWLPVWEYIRQMEVKVIHLRRGNLLDRYLSFKLAERSKIWVKTKEVEDNYNTPITLGSDDCFQDIYRSQCQEKEKEEFFKSLPLLNVTYEDLVRDKDHTILEILNFLNIPLYELTTKIKKQRILSKQNIIENYEELKEILISNTDKKLLQKEWLAFFDDE